MDLSTFITIISILVAVYALLPRATRLIFSLKIIWIDLAVLLLFALSIHYILFFGTFNKLGFVPDILIRDYPFSKNELAYAYLLIFLLVAAVRLYFFSIPVRKYSDFHILVEELLNSTSGHPQLINLLEKSLNKLKKVCNREFWVNKLCNRIYDDRQRIDVLIREFGERDDIPVIVFPPSLKAPILQKSNISYLKYVFRKIVDKPNEHEVSIYPLLKPSNLEYLKEIFLSIICLVLKILPNKNKYTAKACEILTMTLNNKIFVSSIVNLKPYFGIQVYELDMSVSYDFSDRYLQILIENKDSVLYSELKRNENLGECNTYYINENNKLLYYFFNDAEKSKKFGVYKPIGEVILADLENRKLEPSLDEYNYPYQEGEDRGYWDSSVYAGIRFFDIMVREAIYQNINWHMWLYYLAHFTEKICENYSYKHIEEDYFGEYPTRYSFLLYEIIYAHEAWIDMLFEVNIKQKNLKIVPANNNGNPVASSMISLSRCLYEISNCQSIPRRFKHSMIEVGLSKYFKLFQSKKIKQYSSFFKKRLLQGGDWTRENEAYLCELLTTLVEQDNTPYRMDGNIDMVENLMKEILLTLKDKYNISSLDGYIGYEIEGNIVFLQDRMMQYEINLADND